MRLIRQTKLSYQKGSSDKVYEIDLCEAGEGEFIVNFRYGRRGSRLREGTKTPFPESLAKAENLFSALTAEKTAKGYLIGGESGSPALIPEISATASGSDDPRIQGTISRIRRGHTNEAWKLSRAVWRAGQWQLTEALPHLRSLAEGALGMDAWCLVYALGRCGDHTDLKILDLIVENNAADHTLLRIAREARLALLPEEERPAFLEEVVARLPLAVRNALDSPNFTEVLLPAVEDPSNPHSLCADLYLISYNRPAIREALYSLAKTITPSKNGMLLLRQLFKAAEFRRDAEVYGCLVRRFETSPSNGSSGYNWYEKRIIKKPFSFQTKKYLQRRINRTLREAGDESDAATFIPFATGILLAYDDSLDHPQSTSSWSYSYNSETGRYTPCQLHHPARASAHSFLWLLRGRSTTLTYSRGFNWSSTDLITEATTREEVYPELWDAAPDAITHLLAHARAAEVQGFALRVWQDHPEWARSIDVPTIVSFLSSWYSETAELGFTLARERWNPSEPDNDLLLGMLTSQAETAQTLGGTWLGEVAAHARSNPSLLARLAFIQEIVSQQAIRDFLVKNSLTAEVQQDLVARVISALLSLPEEDGERATFAIEVTRQAANTPLLALPQTHLAELAVHSLEPVQLLAVRILLEQNTAANLPEPLLLAPLSSDFSSVRRLGLELLGTLSDSLLAQRAETLAACAISPHADLREHVRPLIEKIAPSQSELCHDLVTRWYPLLLRAESIEGLHTDLYQLLTGPLANSLDIIPPDSFPRMLESKYVQAQALGFVLLKKNANLSQASLADLITWATHAHAELRTYIWEHLNSHPEQLISRLGDGLPLLETNWIDSREAAFAFYRDRVPERAWTPEHLVAICDSTNPHAQDFGREMITHRFRDEDGPQYLAQLSQHPGTELQIFASNYLMRFAVDQPDRIELLEPYFRTVLSKIGAGRTAKRRIFTLLEQEALKDHQTARLVAALLERISATIAIEDKATCIEILLKLSAKWPEIASPLKSTQPELRQPHVV